MNKEEFLKICNNKKFWHWLQKEALVPYKKPLNINSFLNDLYNQIKRRHYYPSPPDKYLTLNKGNGVLRIIPILNLNDLCVFYYCVRKLEKYIAVNHVSGTYGGFGLSGKLQRIEEEDLAKIMNAYEIIEFENDTYVFNLDSDYADLSNLNAKAWFAEWSDFTRKLYFNSANFQDGYVAELDISNFYDSIQLDNLEFKLRKYIPREQSEIIYLLMHFLRFWNRHITFYRQQGAGIPQDLFGECSRILSNFYLQGYDKRISDYCKLSGAKFFRYADDQVIFGNSKEVLEEIIAKASSLLMREGLNFNQKKIKLMTIKEFKKYYSFQNFLDLTKKNGIFPKQSEIEKQIRYYLKNRLSLRKNGVTFLKRIINVVSQQNKRPANFKSLKQHLVSDDFLSKSSLSHIDLKKIYDLLNAQEKITMVNRLQEQTKTCLYTNHLYNLTHFLRSIKQSTTVARNRINWLNKFYQLNP